MRELSDQEAARLIEYADGEMSAQEAREFEQELQGDPALQHALEQLQGAVEAIQTLEPPPPVSDLAEGVRGRIYRRSRGRYFGGRSLYRERVQVQLFISLALAILVAVGLFASRRVLQELFQPQVFENEELSPPQDSAPQDSPPESQAPEAASPEPEHSPSGDDNDESAFHGVPTFEAPPREPREPVAAPVLTQRHQEFQYTIHTAYRGEELERRLINHFGRSALEQDGEGWRARVPRQDQVGLMQGLANLGSISRELVDVEGSRRTLDIRIIPDQ